MITVCTSCRQQCDLITQDHGGTEEVWGAMIWHTQLVDVSDCCEEDFERMTQEQFDEIEETV